LKNKKAELALSDLLSRQDYLVVQGNDLAKSFGGLKSFEQRVLDYCFSYVTRDSKINGKYSLIMLKIWESNRRGKEKYTTVSADLENWQSWFLGKDLRIPAGQFFQKVIARSIEELEEKIPCEFFVTTQKRGRKVIGYEIMITDTSI